MGFGLGQFALMGKVGQVQRVNKVKKVSEPFVLC